MVGNPQTCDTLDVRRFLSGQAVPVAATVNTRSNAKGAAMNTRIAIAALVGMLGASQATADLVYEFQALEGELAGSHITGFITLDDSMAGLTAWNLSQAISFEFHSDFGDGFSWTTEDLIVSFDVAFLGSVGDLVLTPTEEGGEPGYSPDWRMDTEPHTMPGSMALGIGADNANPQWNLVELGGPGNLDYRTSQGVTGAPQWQLVLVPAPASTALLMTCGLIGFRRRR